MGHRADDRLHAFIVVEGSLIAAGGIETIVDCLDKGDIGGPLVALLVEGRNLRCVHSLLVGIDCAAIR